MTPGPLVIVVIPCYRQAEFLAGAVASVVAQTYATWELVIVDDGSPDDTSEVASRLIEQHADHDIRLVRQDNAGVATARNAGISSGSGRFVLPLDADDEIAPRMLERTVATLEAGADVAHTAMSFIGREGGWPAVRIHGSSLAWRDRLAYCSLYRRELWEAHPYSPELVWGHEDWDLWLSFAEAGARFVAIDEPLFRYRVREGTRSADANAHNEEMLAVLRRRHPRSYSLPRRTLGLATWLLPAGGRKLRGKAGTRL